MRTSSTGTNSHGFTLIELMVVLAIAALMSLVVVVSIGPVLRDAKMRSGCRMVASSLNYARSHAVTTNSATRIVFDQGRNVEIDVYADNGTGTQQLIQLTTAAGTRYSLPEGIEITRILKSDNIEDENWLEFTGLGRADGTMIEFSDGQGQKRYVVVDPITGRCRVRTYEEQQQYENSISEQPIP